MRQKKNLYYFQGATIKMTVEFSPEMMKTEI